MAPGGLLHGSPSASSAPLRGLLRLPGRGNLRREISQLYKTSCLRRPGSSRRDKFHILGFVRSRAVGVKKPPPPRILREAAAARPPLAGSQPSWQRRWYAEQEAAGEAHKGPGSACQRLKFSPGWSRKDLGGADLRGQHQEGDKRGARGDPGKGRAGFEVQTGPWVSFPAPRFSPSEM